MKAHNCTNLVEVVTIQGDLIIEKSALSEVRSTVSVVTIDKQSIRFLLEIEFCSRSSTRNH